MIPPSEVPEGKKIVKVGTRKIVSGALLSGAISTMAILNQVMGEALREVPNPDWIEIHLTRYDLVDEEGTDERDVSSAPPGQ